MEQETTRLFEEFDESARGPHELLLPGQLTIRQVRMGDVGALGRISAEREGGDAQAHGAAFGRAIEDDGSGRTSLILVAELDSDIVGFGKVRYLGKEHRADESESPEGWYLTGVVVDPQFRRRGVGSRLTSERLQWIAERSRSAYYFANVKNRVSTALHGCFGFVEIARGPEFAGVSFAGGEGILFQADLGGT